MTRPALVSAAAESLRLLIVEERIPDTEVVIACVMAKREGITGAEPLAALDLIDAVFGTRPTVH